MSLRDEIVTEVQSLPESVLPALHKTIQQLREKNEEPGLLRRLQQIKIKDLPPDYSRNIDLYLSGEKKLDDNAD